MAKQVVQTVETEEVKLTFQDVLMQSMRKVNKLTDAGCGATLQLKDDDVLELRLPPTKRRSYEEFKTVSAKSDQWEMESFLEAFETELRDLAFHKQRGELLLSTLRSLTKEQREVLLESHQDGSLEGLLRYTHF